MQAQRNNHSSLAITLAAVAFGYLACSTKEAASSEDTSRSYVQRLRANSKLGAIICTANFRTSGDFENLRYGQANSGETKLGEKYQLFEARFSQIEKRLSQQNLDDFSRIQRVSEYYGGYVAKEVVESIPKPEFSPATTSDKLVFRIDQFKKFEDGVNAELRQAVAGNLALGKIASRTLKMLPSDGSISLLLPRFDHQGDGKIFFDSISPDVNSYLIGQKKALEIFKINFGVPCRDLRRTELADDLLKQIGVSLESIERINAFSQYLFEPTKQRISHPENRALPHDIALNFMQALIKSPAFFDYVTSSDHEWEDALGDYLLNQSPHKKALLLKLIADLSTDEFSVLVSDAIPYYLRNAGANATEFPSDEVALRGATIFEQIRSTKLDSPLAQELLAEVIAPLRKCTEWPKGVQIISSDSGWPSDSNLLDQIQVALDKRRHDGSKKYRYPARRGDLFEIVSEIRNAEVTEEVDSYKLPNHSSNASEGKFDLLSYPGLTQVLFIVGKDSEKDGNRYLKQIERFKAEVETVINYTCNVAYNSSEQDIRQLLRMYTEVAGGRRTQLLIVLCGEGHTSQSEGLVSYGRDYGHVITGSRSQISEYFLKAEMHAVAPHFDGVTVIIQADRSNAWNL